MNCKKCKYRGMYAICSVCDGEVMFEEEVNNVNYKRERLSEDFWKVKGNT